MSEIDLISLVKSAVNLLCRVSSSKNMRSSHAYRRISTELNNLQVPLNSLDELRMMTCVGERSFDRIQGVIDKKIGRDVKNMEDLDRYVGIISSKAYEDVKRRQMGGGCEENVMNLGRRDVRRYIPGYRSGGYAIMKALWLKDGISKHEIAHVGRHYCDSGFDFTSRHSGWSSMKSLVKKGLVYKEGRTRFYLTEDGRKMAMSLFANTSIVEEGSGGVVLVIDSREMKNRKSRMFFQEYFESRNVTQDTRVLEVGDFLWIRNERLCDSIVERKKGSDFVSSIMDGRFKEQKNRLKKSGIKRIFYVVEDLRNSQMLRIGREVGRSCLSTTKLEGFIVMETADISQTGSVICMIDEEIRCRYDVAVEEENEDMDDVPEELTMSYGSFIDKSSKGSNKNPMYLFYISLLSIRGINHKKAWELANCYESIDRFIMKMNECVDELYDFKVDGKRMSKRSVDDMIEFFLR